MATHDLSELTTHCIRCGFCLESCPTFKVTGEETESPRGRIYLIRSAVEGKLDWKEDVAPHMDRCLGCRACETACPSGVEYGAIFELAKERIEAVRPSIVRKTMLKGLTQPTVARLQFKFAKLLPQRKMPGFMNRWIADGPAEAKIPTPMPKRTFAPLDEGQLQPIRGEVALLLGCVMRVLYDPVHEATERLLRRAGFRVHRIQSPCCGALHAHSGLLDEARAFARQLIDAVPAGMPIVVNSAGCGSTMKEYSALNPDWAEFAHRVVDVSEFLEREGFAEVLRSSHGVEAIATYHDACHLAHGQGITEAPRVLLRAIPRLVLRELPEADTCCGSAGIYNIQQPQLARQLLDRKWANVERTQAQIVVTGNPGCHAWIEQGSAEHGGRVRVLHTMEMLEAAFSGLPR